jgi:serine/threonine protein phosphatase 1
MNRHMTTCAIGDIHGCPAPLTALLDLVADRADRFVFLGDYVDRGPDAKAVVDLLLAFVKRHDRVITLQGNHDQMFSQYLAGQDHTTFLQYGGRTTLASYGISPTAQGERAHLLPQAHRRFFDQLLLHWEDEHAIYVHAGLQPGRHLSLQRPDWCLWARQEFLNTDCRFGKPVVFGHTVFNAPLVRPDKIGLDTGAVYGGRLSALLLPELEFISVPGEQDAPWTGP